MLEADTGREALSFGDVVGLRNILGTVIDSEDVTSKPLSQEESAGTIAASHIEGAALRRETQQLAKALGELQSTWMKRVAKLQFGEVALVDVRAALFEGFRIRGVGVWRNASLLHLIDQRSSAVSVRCVSVLC